MHRRQHAADRRRRRRHDDATAPVAGSVAVIDPDAGQTVTLTIASGPAHGTATVAQDGSFIYTPTGTYTGPRHVHDPGLRRRVRSACATGTVNVAIYPVAVADATATSEGRRSRSTSRRTTSATPDRSQIVSGPAHGTATHRLDHLHAGPGFTGTDAVVYRICSPNDETLCAEATLTIHVDPPVPDTGTQPIGVSPDPTPPWSLPLAFIVLLSVVVGAALVLRRRADEE